MEGECSKIFHKPPILNFASRSKINDEDDKTHQLADWFHILAFQMYIHTNKELKKIVSVGVRVTTSNESASSNVK